MGQWVCRVYMFVQTVDIGKADNKDNTFGRSDQCVNQREEINPFVYQTFSYSDIIKCQSSDRKLHSSLAVKPNLQISWKESLKEADLLFLLQLVWSLPVCIRLPIYVWKLPVVVYTKWYFSTERFRWFSEWHVHFICVLFLSNNSNAGMCNLISHITKF